jgi:hypothetical protein
MPWPVEAARAGAAPGAPTLVTVVIGPAAVAPPARRDARPRSARAARTCTAIDVEAFNAVAAPGAPVLVTVAIGGPRRNRPGSHRGGQCRGRVEALSMPSRCPVRQPLVTVAIGGPAGLAPWSMPWPRSRRSMPSRRPARRPWPHWRSAARGGPAPRSRPWPCRGARCRPIAAPVAAISRSGMNRLTSRSVWTVPDLLGCTRPPFWA